MTLIQVSDGQNVFTVDQGLTESIEAVLTNNLEGYFIDICTEQMVSYINNLMQTDNIINVKAMATFPEFPAGKGKEITSNMQLPFVAVSTSLLGHKEVGVGRGIRGSIKGTVMGFRQYVQVQFDCHSTSQLMSARVIGKILFSLQRDKMSVLRQKGFIDIRNLYSNSARGFSPAYGFDVQARDFPNRIFRHIAYLETEFDVIWIRPDTNSSVISAIIFNQSSSYDLANISLGASWEYLLAEELYYGWHPIF